MIIIQTNISIYFKDCILNLKIRSPIFQIGDTFGLPLTVKDYVKTDVIAGSSTKFAYQTAMGHVTVLVWFNLLCSKICGFIYH